MLNHATNHIPNVGNKLERKILIILSQTKRILLICVLLLHQVVVTQNSIEHSNYKHKNHFIENKGQILDQNGNPNKDVFYLLNTNGLNVQLRKNGFSYDVYDGERNKDSTSTELFKPKIHRIDFDFLNYNPKVNIKTFDLVSHKLNYYNVIDKPDGVLEVKSFKKIVYENLYPNIDLEFFVPPDPQKPVEYNFIIHPNGNISDIKMQIGGAKANLHKSYLEIKTDFGVLKETIPLSWTEKNGVKSSCTINYERLAANIFGFQNFNHKKSKKSTIIIDPTPVREWGTYFGGFWGNGSNLGNVDTDQDKNSVYVTSTTSWDNIATAGSHQTDNFILSTSLRHNTGLMMKFDQGGILLWATYYGGVGPTEFLDVKTDSENNILAGGYTYSETHIATQNSHQENLSNEADGFLVKFNSNGVRLWSSYYGGLGADRLNTVSVDSSDNIYIAGSTISSNNIATVGAHDEQVDDNSYDGFIAKFSPEGIREWGTYYGGSDKDEINELSIGTNGNIYLVGSTESVDNIATPGSFQDTLHINVSQTSDREDAFVTKFNSDGSIIWGTYFGGDAIDWGYGLALDSDNNVIISGATQSLIDISYNNSHQPTKGGDISDWDDFLAKFSENGEMLWSSYYGGEERENYVACAVDVDSENNIFLTGGTYSLTNISTSGVYQEDYPATASGHIVYLVKFDELGNREWGTYYSDFQTTPTDVHINDEAIYIFGNTSSLTGISTDGAHQTDPNSSSNQFSSYSDLFIAKFRECGASITVNVTEFLCVGEDIELNASGGISYSWTGPNGFVSNSANPIVTNADINDSGIYSVSIESADGCEFSTNFNVTVSNRPIVNTIANIEACEDQNNQGFSNTFDTSNVEAEVLGSQINMTVSYYDQNSNLLPSPLPNPFSNSIQYNETITVRVANNNNPDCYEETSFQLIVNPLPLISNLEDLVVCDDNNDGYSTFDTTGIETTLIGNQNNVSLTLFDGNGNSLPSPLPNPLSNSVQNIETITARIINDDTNCYSETAFDLVVNPNPIAHPIDPLLGCDDNDDGISEYFDTSNVENHVLNGQTGMTVTYSTENGIELASPLPNPFTNTETNNQNIIVRVENQNSNCFSETILELQTVTQPNITQPNNLYACDQGDGFSEFNTTQLEEQIIGNQTGLTIKYYDANNNELTSPLPLLFQNTTAFNQIINVRVENVSSPICFFETSFNLIVNRLPEINLEEDYFICDFEPSINLAVNSSFNSYAWYFEDGTLISSSYSAELINQGDYTLTVTQLENDILCENSFSFSLIRYNLPEITEVNYGQLGNNYIEIIASGNGDLEYSLDGINYQDSNYFPNIQGGTYTAFVRDKEGCGEDMEEVTIIDYPKFFTPNNDGYNDYWQIEGIEKYPNNKILIFDRYGKLLTQLSLNSLGWDGFYNGKEMPSNDYWFTANLNNEIIFSGHFALKR